MQRDRSPLDQNRSSHLHSSTRVSVSNLPADMPWQELKELLQEHVGDVVYVDMKARGSATVAFKHEHLAVTAIRKMSGYEIRGKKLVVTKDAVASGSNVYVSNLPFDATWKEIKQIFNEKVGGVNFVNTYSDERGNPRGSASINFVSEVAAKKAVTLMNRYEIRNRKISVQLDSGNERNKFGRIIIGSADTISDEDFGNTYGLSVAFLKSLGVEGRLHTRIFVLNLDYALDEKRIREVFQLAGRIVNVEMQRDKDGKFRGFAKIEYSHPIEAVQAISMFNGQQYCERELGVRLDKIPPYNGPIVLPDALPEGLPTVGPGLGIDGLPMTKVPRALMIQFWDEMQGPEENLPGPDRAPPADISSRGISELTPVLTMLATQMNQGISSQNHLNQLIGGLSPQAIHTLNSLLSSQIKAGLPVHERRAGLSPIPLEAQGANSSFLSQGRDFIPSRDLQSSFRSEMDLLKSRNLDEVRFRSADFDPMSRTGVELRQSLDREEYLRSRLNTAQAMPDLRDRIRTKDEPPLRAAMSHGDQVRREDIFGASSYEDKLRSSFEIESRMSSDRIPNAFRATGSSSQGSFERFPEKSSHLDGFSRPKEVEKYDILKRESLTREFARDDARDIIQTFEKSSSRDDYGLVVSRKDRLEYDLTSDAELMSRYEDPRRSPTLKSRNPFLSYDTSEPKAAGSLSSSLPLPVASSLGRPSSADIDSAPRTSSDFETKSRVVSDTVMVTNLPDDLTWQELGNAFKLCGDVRSAIIKHPGTGLVRFMSTKAAELALCLNDSTKWGKKLHIGIF